MNIKQFFKEIAIPVFRAVIGKNGKRLILLISILFTSILVLGLANSAKVLLKEKMDDPFIRFIDVSNPIQTPKSKEKFDVRAADSLVKTPLLSLKQDYSKVIINWRDFKFMGKTKQLKGVQLTEDDIFYKHLMDKKNKLILTKNKFSDKGYGIIVSLKFFKDFGIVIDKESWDTHSFVTIMDKHSNPVNIPIAAVVKELRHNCSFAISENLLETLYYHTSELQQDDTKKTYFIAGNFDIIPKYFYKVSSPNLSDNCYKGGMLISTADTSLKCDLKGSIEVLDLTADNTLSIQQTKLDISFYSFFLNDLSKAKEISDKIDKKYGLQIEQSKIKAKDDFDFFDKITNLLYFALLAFSMLSIILFIVNILMSHLEKNKRSLGTLKAFGLSNGYILALYCSISLFLVSFCFMLSFILSKLLGSFAIDIFVWLNKWKNASELGFKFINFDLRMLILAMVIVPSLFILLRIFKFLHKITPGDLIYERK